VLARVGLLSLLVACASPSVEPPTAVTVARSIAEAPGWTVRYGEEFWRRAQTAASPDIGDVIERVTYAIRERTSDGSTMRGRTYTATFDGAGVRLADTRVQTRAIAVGDRALGAPRTWSILGNTAQGLVAPGIVEHHELGADGDAISWVVQDPIEGDLAVELAIDDPSRLRIGAAALVDAAGRRTPIATEHVDGALRWHVDAALLADAAYPVALDPIVGPELGVASPITTNEGRQYDPAVASNGTVWLVVWTDALEPGIYGTRIANGSSTPLDTSGIAISPGGIDAREPAVASNGAGFLVAWQRMDHSPPQTRSTIHAARVTGAGAVTDPASLAITDLMGPDDSAAYPAVASNGTDYLVAWQDNRGTTYRSVYGSLVSASGSGPVANGFLVADAPMLQGYPAVASNGANYLVVWQDERNGLTNIDIYGARVTSAGVVQDPAGFAITGLANQTEPAVASSGGGYLVAWSDNRNTATEDDIYGARVAANGTVTDASGIPIAIAANRQYAVAVTNTAAGYLVGWSDFSPGQRVYAARVENGVVPAADANGILLAAGHNEDHLALAFNGTEVLAAWWSHGATNEDFDVAVRRIAADGSLVDANPTVVSAAPSHQYGAKIAASASGFLVVWSDGRDPASSWLEVLGTRVSTTGTVLDVNGLQITSNATGYVESPNVASNGTDYLVVFDRSPGMTGTRVLANGTMPDGVGFLIRTGIGSAAVGSDGVGYLVVGGYTAFTPGGPDGDYDGQLEGALVSAAGVVGPSITVSNAPGHQFSPSIASTKVAGEYLVVWQDERHRVMTSSDIYGARISGGVRVPGDIEVFRAPGRQFFPRVASTGLEYFVAWATAPFSGGSDSAQAAIVSAAGVSGPPITLPFAGEDFVYGGLTEMGTGYLAGLSQPPGSGFTIDARVMRLSPTGMSLDGTGLVVANTVDRELVQAVACTQGGPCLLAYDRRGRVRLRLINVACGNSILDGGETCDDGNNADGDGCAALCSTEPGYTCTGTPSVCSDLDECATGNGGCAQTCTNTVGGFTCACGTGYVLATDGHSCDDIDECATNNGGCAETCTNTAGGFTCNCQPGYEASNGACNDIDECATGNGGCAQTCTNTPGSFTCEDKPTGGGGCSTTHPGGLVGVFLGLGFVLRRRRRHAC
jgi:uncharacterized protein (TIGR03382 family)